MKKKEKEHLKEDPFQHFIENSIATIRENTKLIVAGFVTVVVVIAVIVGYFYFKSGSIESENALYAEALKIQDSDTLTAQQKIEKLNNLENKKGISSSIKLSTAAIYFGEGDMKKAKETLEQFPGSKFKLITDKKILLEAEILNIEGKDKEALDILNKLYSDAKCDIAKDYLLLKMAKIQIKAKQFKLAEANLNKISEDFARSAYSGDAQVLLKEIKAK
ncbi:MAG: tetratricopeptide repeat protein [bacterium]|nr:tetratricopeptide repeat protein [bacterium]